MSRIGAPRHAARAEILRFWRSVELFSPQGVPDADPGTLVYDLPLGSPAPWEPGHPASNASMAPGKRWRHTVYCGLFEHERAFELVRQQLPADPESFDDRPARGQGALFALVVSHAGRAVLGSELLSSCAWAVGRAVDPGPDAAGWLHGLDDDQDGFSVLLQAITDPPDDEQFSDAVAGRERVGSRPLTVQDLLELTQRVVALVGVESLAATGLRVSSRAVDASHADDGEDHDFLNSFIAADLGMVADEIQGGNVGSALASYLTFDNELRVGERLDVEQRVDVVYDSVAPGRVPLGRWPVQADRSLGLSQQLAVSNAMGSLEAASGIFAVNGPPGTGKTTMLREVIADVVVGRARELAALADPADAFIAEHRWKTGDYTRVVHEFAAELTGFEIVVACATNTAAENISIEIPGIDAIDPSRRSTIDYYPRLASRLLATKRTDPAAGTEAWAMIAGCLGNMNNRRRFTQALWHDEKPKPKRREPTGSSTSRMPADAADPGQRGLRAILKEYEDEPSAPPWPDAVADFQAAVDNAQRLADERAHVFDLLNDAESVNHDAELRRRRAAAARAELADARHRLVERQSIAAAQQAIRDERERAVREHRDTRPNPLLPGPRDARLAQTSP